MNAVDVGVKDERKTPWFEDSGPPILPAERNLSVRPGGELWIRDEASGVVDVQTCPLEQRHFATEDGVDDVSGIDIDDKDLCPVRRRRPHDCAY